MPRRLAPRPGAESALTRMTRELLDYRLHLHRTRTNPDLAGDAFRCVVTWNRRDPIIKLPSIRRAPDRPSGELDVRLPDGAVWRFRFMREYCNVARPAGTDRNRLPDLLRDWFGPNAGHPGTRFEVAFERSPDGWWIEPVGSAPSLPRRGLLVAYPSLRAAAGAATDGHVELSHEYVSLPFDGPADVFAVRVAGDSMNGGKKPIRDGDWLVMRWARGVGVGTLAGRVALIQISAGHETFAYQVKRIVQQDDRWWLRSDNPEVPAIEATAETIPIAQLVDTVSPEAIAPPVGERVAPEDVSATFGLDLEIRIERDGRYQGHLFLLVTARDQFTHPDRLARVIVDRRPAETAFVLARPTPDDPWRYCGVARWLEENGAWRLPDLDFANWRALGKGRDCSRRLPVDAIRRAGELLDELWRRVGAGAWVEHNGKRCRIVERLARGVRVDGGEGGFAARQVSVTDVAWVMLAAEDVARSGGVLDEVRVNRLRYLEGTPKGSTRWIDTGWAIVLVAAATKPSGD